MDGQKNERLEEQVDGRISVCVRVHVFCSDPGSGLSSISFGLGRSPRDVLVQDWRSIALEPSGMYQVSASVSNGVNVWVRVQVGNQG